MITRSIYKVPNGKLLKIFLDFDKVRKSINKIDIMGDFFVYPEETIELIENKLKDSIIDKNILLGKINSLVEKYNIEFIGLDPEAIVQGILMCVKWRNAGDY